MKAAQTASCYPTGETLLQANFDAIMEVSSWTARAENATPSGIAETLVEDVRIAGKIASQLDASSGLGKPVVEWFCRNWDALFYLDGQEAASQLNQFIQLCEGRRIGHPVFLAAVHARKSDEPVIVSGLPMGLPEPDGDAARARIVQANTPNSWLQSEVASLH